MSTSFSSFGGLQFSSLGLTSSVTGLTLTTTIFDSVSGGTASTSVVPTGLNYVLGSAMSQIITGQSYQTFTSGILSLTTNSTRIVEVSLVPDTSSGYIEVNNPDFTSAVATFRALRGPSTIIGEVTLLSEDTGSTDDYVIRIPCSAFRFMDFNPPSGSATYVIQTNPTGSNSTVVVNGAKLFVRQL